MDEREVKTAFPISPPEPEKAYGTSEARGQLALEWERLRLERQKHALELRFRRREVAEKQNKNVWKSLLTNPVTIAIVGGVVALLTTIATNFLTARDNRIAEAWLAPIWHVRVLNRHYKLTLSRNSLRVRRRKPCVRICGFL